MADDDAPLHQEIVVSLETMPKPAGQKSSKAKQLVEAIRSRRAAFLDHDADRSKNAHDKIARLVCENNNMHKLLEERHAGGTSQYIKSVIFGGLDGIITTFAVVSAVAGAGLSSYLVLLMGVSNLVADGLSMGVGDYLSTKAELDYVNNEYRREKWEMDNYLEGEVAEMQAIYEQKGVEPSDAQQMLSIMAKYPDVFLRTMMLEELGLMPPEGDESPWKNGVVTFLSFMLFGAIPLIGYTAIPVQTTKGRFIVTCVLTGAMLATLGFVKAGLTGAAGWARIRAALEMLINGGLAAAAAYLIGLGFSQIHGYGEC